MHHNTITLNHLYKFLWILSQLGYFLFPNFKKKWLDCKKFAKNTEIEFTVNGYCEDLNGSRCKQGVEAIEYCWKKYIYWVVMERYLYTPYYNLPIFKFLNHIYTVYFSFKVVNT